MNELQPSLFEPVWLSLRLSLVTVIILLPVVCQVKETTLLKAYVVVIASLSSVVCQM